MRQDMPATHQGFFKIQLVRAMNFDVQFGQGLVEKLGENLPFVGQIAQCVT